MRKTAVLILLLAGIVLSCGCTHQASPADITPLPPAQEAVQGPTEHVGLKASSYNPEHLYIRAGTMVVWTNEEDRISRRVVHLPSSPGDSVAFESGSLAPGESFSFTFTTPGRYVYADPQHGGARSPFVEVAP